MNDVLRLMGFHRARYSREAISTLFTCVKNEGPYLLEWIAFHKVQGFDEIVIYDNCSDDGTAELLAPLAAAGEIEYRRQENLPNVPPQSAAAKDAVARCKSRWLAMLDADEFLVLHGHRSVNDYLEGSGEEVSQISLNWRLFGSGGQQRRTDGLVIERFQMASVPDEPKNAHAKSITRTTRFQSPNVHAPFITGGLAVHDDGSPRWMQTQGLTDRISHSHASVHHYVVKSREEFDGKIARGRGAVPAGSPEKLRKNPEVFFKSHDLNAVRNTDALMRIADVHTELRRLERLVRPAQAKPATVAQPLLMPRAGMAGCAF